MRPIDCATFDRELPWLANDTIEPGTRAALERHAERCTRCRQEWELEKRIIAAIRADDDEALDGESLDPAFARIERHIERPRPLRRQRLYAVIIAQAAAIAVLAVALVWQWRSSSTAEYRTVTTAATTYDNEIAVLRVAMAPQGREEAAGIFARSGVRALADPSPNGIYTVTPITGSADAALTALIELRSESGVLFAEIVQLGAATND
jgi:anti-sigma factor RsiW